MQNSLSVTALEYDRVSTEVARYRVMFCERKGVKKRGYKLSQHLVCVFLLKFQKSAVFLLKTRYVSLSHPKECHSENQKKLQVVFNIVW